jgi:hypothetical protein
MTLTRKHLREWEKSGFVRVTEEQRRIFLDRFGTEPWPHEWSEQDIVVQIQNFLFCGEFEKSIRNTGDRSDLPVGEDF